MKIHTEKKKKKPQILSQLIQLFLQLVPGSLWIPKPTDTQVLYIKCRQSTLETCGFIHPQIQPTVIEFVDEEPVCTEGQLYFWLPFHITLATHVLIRSQHWT